MILSLFLNCLCVFKYGMNRVDEEYKVANPKKLNVVKYCIGNSTQ